MAAKKSFLQEQSEARQALVRLPEGGVFDGAALFSPAESEALRAAIREARRQSLRVYVVSTQNAGVAHTLAKALFEQLQRDDQDVVVVVGEDRVAAWAARLDQAHIAAQIRQTSHARAQGTFAGTRALIDGLAAARASQASRWALFWMALTGTLLAGVAIGVLVWIGKQRARVTAYTRELNRLYDRAAQVGDLLEEVELESRFQPDDERVRQLIHTARERYLMATAQLEHMRAGHLTDSSTALPALSHALEDAQNGLEKARRLLQGSSPGSAAQTPPEAAPPKTLGDRAFSPERPRDDGRR
jgi:hypothetical protein